MYAFEGDDKKHNAQIFGHNYLTLATDGSNYGDSFGFQVY